MNYGQQKAKRIGDLSADCAKVFVENKLFNEKGALITTSQIRKFLSAVNSLENKVLSCDKELSSELANEIKYLKVKLAYQVGRENGNTGLKNLYNELEPLINQIGASKDNFKKFARYVEAIVAYHKFNGGK